MEWPFERCCFEVGVLPVGHSVGFSECLGFGEEEVQNQGKSKVGCLRFIFIKFARFIFKCV